MRNVRALAVKWRDLGSATPQELPNRHQATLRARHLLSQPSQHEFHVTSDADKDCLYAALSIAGASLPGDAIRTRASALITATDWPGDRFGELADLKEESDKLVAGLDQKVGMEIVEKVPATARRATVESRDVNTTTKISNLVTRLTRLIEYSPRDVFRISKDAIGLIEESCPTRTKLVGELTLLAGASARFLHLYKEAIALFDAAEIQFRESNSSAGDFARIRYQRLTVALEARQLDSVLRESPSLQSVFERLDMEEWAEKCLYLWGTALRERGNFRGCLRVMEEVYERSLKIGSLKMQAMSLTTMAGNHAELGDANLAIDAAAKARAVLRRFRSPLTLAKLHWSLGTLLRSLEKFEEAEVVHRAALRELEKLGFPAEVAAIRVVLTDTLLRLGRDDDARAELHAALPDLDRYEMFHESVAAVALLRASLRRNKIDRSALNRLPGLRPRPN